MRCPYCAADDDKVVDSRAADEGEAIRRRRMCRACGERFTTYEHVEREARVTVIKRDGTRVPYDREKILGGLEKACYKRPVSAETLAGIADAVGELIGREYPREVEALEIGRAVAERLKEVDHIAYVRFASVYKQFRDLDDFLAEVREVLDTTEGDRPGQGRLF